jgi:hypothetical protein
VGPKLHSTAVGPHFWGDAKSDYGQCECNVPMALISSSIIQDFVDGLEIKRTTDKRSHQQRSYSTRITIIRIMMMMMMLLVLGVVVFAAIIVIIMMMVRKNKDS